MRFVGVVRLAATCASLFIAGSADAGQTVAPIAVSPPSIVELRSPWTTILRRVAATGDSLRLVEAVFEALDDVRRAGLGDGCCDPTKDYFLVSFVGADPTGTPELITVLAHNPMPTTTTLPGLHGGGQPVYDCSCRTISPRRCRRRTRSGMKRTLRKSRAAHSRLRSSRTSRCRWRFDRPRRP